MLHAAGNRNASLDGGLAVAVPMEVRGLWAAHRAWGRRPWATLVAPAAGLARNGFPAHPYLINVLSGPLQAKCGYKSQRLSIQPSDELAFSCRHGVKLMYIRLSPLYRYQARVYLHAA